MAEAGKIRANASSSHWKATFFASLGGIATGIFFGEYCEVLEPLAQAAGLHLSSGHLKRAEEMYRQLLEDEVQTA